MTSYRARRVGTTVTMVLVVLLLAGTVLNFFPIGVQWPSAAAASGPPLPSKVPSGIIWFAPLTLRNLQSTSTPAPFQDLVTLDSSAYSFYEAPNLQNVEFFYSDGTIVPTWIESGNSNQATNTTYWLKLNSGVGAGVTLTIYVGFASQSRNLFNSQTTGEAPTLSPTYGQYDDGEQVFQYYDNFAGNTLDANWTLAAGPGATGTVSVDNGLTVSGQTNWYGVVSSFEVNPQAAIVDYYGYFSSFSGSDIHEFGFNNPNTPLSPNTLYAINNYGNQYALINSDGQSSSEIGIGPGNTPSPEVLSIWSSVQASFASINYTSPVTNTATFIGELSAPLSSYARSGSQFLQLVRMRSLPPNGAMLSSNEGGVYTVSATSVTCNSSGIVIGSSTHCTATVRGNLPSGIVNWGSSAPGSFVPTSCQLFQTAGFSCSVTYTPSSTASPETITATYLGDANNYGSSNATTLYVKISASTTTVGCTPAQVLLGAATKCTASVSGSAPTGTVSWASSSKGQFIPNPCTLSSGACSVSFKLSTAASPVTISATYGGDARNIGSQGSFEVTNGTTTTATTTTTTTSSAVPSRTLVSCLPAQVAVGTASLCSATVSGNSPTGSVGWRSDEPATFSPPTCNLSAGSCQATVTPLSSSSPITVTASYGGDRNNGASSGSFSITVVASTTSSTSTSTSSVSQTTRSTQTLSTVLPIPKTTTSISSGASIDYMSYIYAGVIVVIVVVAAALVLRGRGGQTPSR